MWPKPLRGIIELVKDEASVKHVDITPQASGVSWHTTFSLPLESIRPNSPESLGGRGTTIVDTNTREKFFFAITELNDIFISIKTTGKFHRNRIDLLLKTWLTLASDQVTQSANLLDVFIFHLFTI
jgi:hypothetical protein